MKKLMRVSAVALAAVILPAVLGAPASWAAEKQATMLVAVQWFETARPKMGAVFAIRLMKHSRPSYERCQAAAHKWNARQKVGSTAILRDPFKYQIVCYRAALTLLEDVTMDICGKVGLLYQRTCNYLLYRRPFLKQYKSGELIQGQ